MIRQTITKTDIAKFNTHLRTTGKSDNTLQKYNRDITDFQRYLSEHDMKLSGVAVDAYVKHLLDNEYSVSSVNTVIGAINTFCSFIERNDIHCTYLKNLVSVRESKEYLSTDEYQRLIEQAVHNEEYWLANFIQTIGNMDIRLNELDRLTIDSLKYGYITVTRAHSKCEVKIPDELLKDLQEYVHFAGIDEGIIFRSSNGNALDRSNIFRTLKRLAGEAEVDQDKVSPSNLKRQLAKDFYSIEYKR